MVKQTMTSSVYYVVYVTLPITSVEGQGINLHQLPLDATDRLSLCIFFLIKCFILYL